MKRALVMLILALLPAIVAGCGTAATTGTPVPAATAAAQAKESLPTSVPTAAPTTGSTPTKTPTKAPTKVSTPTVASNTSSSGSDVLDKMKTIKSFYADFTTKDSEKDTKGKMTFSGNRMRMDVEEQGVTTAFMADGNEKTAYIYNPAEKKALSMPFDQGVTGETPGNLLGWDTNTIVPPKLLGQETVDGKACVIYEFTTAKAKSKVWIDKATGFPIKYDSTQDGKTVSTHFTKILIGNVDETLLVLPEGTEILDISGLMATATPTPKGAKTATPTSKGGATPTTSSGSSTLFPTTIVGAVPEALKTNVQIPSGFTLQEFSGQLEENTDTGVFRASAKWSGSATPPQIADFYAGLLAGKWQSQGKIVSDLNIDLDYKKTGTDPAITLNVIAVRGASGTVLTLTIANGDPNADDSAP